MWKLNDNHFTNSDREKISEFILDPTNRWTADYQVKTLEEEWSKVSGYKYTLLTSSGSTAIEILARTWKYFYGRAGKILVPALTWSTSINPWIYAGFSCEFVDIDPNTLCISYQDASKKSSKNDAGIFPTNTLGANIDLSPLLEINKNVAIDNCESTFAIGNADRNVTTVTSFYMGHQFTTGTEGGMIFTNDEEEFRYMVLCRAHGLERELYKYGLINKYEDFKFVELGSNFRSSDLAAYMGRLDLARAYEKRVKRRALLRIFNENIHEAYHKYDLFVPFALPIVSSVVKPDRVKEILYNLDIEFRPIVGGNLLKNPIYSLHNKGGFPGAEYIDKNGLYVGLHEGIQEEQVHALVEYLNAAVI